MMCASTKETMVRCRVAACAVLRGTADEIAQLRCRPVVVGAEAMPATFLKHAEDQTVLAVASVLRALTQEGWQDRAFAAWGVIAAPNLFARTMIDRTLHRYRQEGAWGVSPHLAPHQSLHAMSGTISQALQIHGPNFGSGGGPNATLDAFLAAGALMQDGALPGLWLVLTGYETEWVPSADPAVVRPAPPCQAIALALTPADDNAGGLHLGIGHCAEDTNNNLSIAHLPELHLAALAEALSGHADMRGGSWRLADAHWLELETRLPAEGSEA